MPGHPTAIPRSTLVASLSIAVAVLSAIAAIAGLFWKGGDGTYSITTYRGQAEDIFGTGIYRDSSAFAGAGARGSDLITLLVVIPLLAIALTLYWRGSIRGTLLLGGALTWFAYLHGSLALGTVAYNDLFLVYVATFGASLWGLVLLLVSVDLTVFSSKLEPGIPRRGLGAFLVAAGVVTTGIWLVEPIGAVITGDLPASLGVSTTLVTYALDIAVIAPAIWVAGTLVLRGRAAGYLFAVPLLTLATLLTPMIVAQTIFQVDAGVEFSTGEIVGPIGGFVVMSLVANWFNLRILRHVAEDSEPVRGSGRPAQSAPAD